MAREVRTTDEPAMHSGWRLGSNDDGSYSVDRVQAFLLGGIQAELRKQTNLLEGLLAILRCPNFQRMPLHLREIAADTTAKRKARKAREKARQEGQR